MKKLYVNSNKKRKKTHKKKTIKIFKKRLDEANKIPKIKSVAEFDETHFNSIKSIAVKKHCC